MNAWTTFSASETLNMIRSLEMFLRWKNAVFVTWQSCCLIKHPDCIYTYIEISAVKQLIVINRVQKKKKSVYIIYVCILCIFIMYK